MSELGEEDIKKSKHDSSIHSDTLGLSLGGEGDLEMMGRITEEVGGGRGGWVDNDVDDGEEEEIVMSDNPMASAKARNVSALDSNRRVYRKGAGRKGAGGQGGGVQNERNRTESKLEAKGTIQLSRKNSTGCKMNEVFQTLGEIKGILVEYPLDFLKDDFAKLKTTMIPTDIFK